MEENYGVNPSIISTCWFPTEKDARAAELIWHKRFKEFRSDDHGGREWFALSQSQVTEFTHWCSYSMDHIQLLDGLFKGHLSLKQIKQLTDNLFFQIPKPMPRNSIDLWVAEQFNSNYDYCNNESRAGFCS
jgi:hypothetical protein